MDFLDTTDKKERRLVHVPMGRFGEANEQAKAVLFLASNESSFVTGIDMPVDGGLTSAYVVSVLYSRSSSKLIWLLLRRHWVNPCWLLRRT